MRLLNDTIRKAYAEDELTRILYEEFDLRLSDIAPKQATYITVVYSVLSHFESTGELDRLLLILAARNPKNQQLRKALVDFFTDDADKQRDNSSKKYVDVPIVPERSELRTIEQQLYELQYAVGTKGTNGIIGKQNKLEMKAASQDALIERIESSVYAFKWLMAISLLSSFILFSIIIYIISIGV